MRRTTMLFLTLWLLVMPCAALAAAPLDSGQGLFAVSWSQSPCSPNKRCLLGNIPPGTPLVLLSRTSNVTCRTQALKNFESGWDTGSFPLTALIPGKCTGFASDLAVRLSRPVAFERANLASLQRPDLATLRRIDTAIRAAAPSLSPKALSMAFELSASTPRIFRLPAMDPDAWIAEYEAMNVFHEPQYVPLPQAHFYYVGGKVLLIHPGAYLRMVFMLDGSWYVHYQLQCRLDCAFGGDSVVRFSGHGFEYVMEDTSGSD